MHKYFKDVRVQIDEKDDGRTEWFISSRDEVEDTLDEILKATHELFDDYSKTERKHF